MTCGTNRPNITTNDATINIKQQIILPMQTNTVTGDNMASKGR